MATLANLDTPVEGSDNAFAVFKKCENKLLKTWLFDAVSEDETVPTCYPIGFNSSTGNAAKWMAPDPTVLVIDTDDATGGTFGLTVNGIEIANTVLAYNATSDLVEATIKASIGITASVSLADGVYTITFDDEDEVSELPTVTGDASALTGGTASTATVTAGTSSYGTHNIKGIVWPEPAYLYADGEIAYDCMVEGKVDFEELEDVIDEDDVEALTEACQSELLPRGLNVQNISNVR